jgi:hypothetical protein
MEEPVTMTGEQAVGLAGNEERLAHHEAAQAVAIS